MSLLFRIVYAGHANGTHHKLALDALQRLTRADADAWQRLFLKHAELYLEGSKAPDNTFKDFKNHVLHVRDGYWGGAPEKVVSWYEHLVTALRDRQWQEAVWCAGVLSHYYTDPIHPFHTAQSEAENSIHRAVEWSINRDYDALKREAEAIHTNHMLEAPRGPHWLKDFVCQGADKSNAYYEKLIAHYDINVGVVDPLLGLDSIARELVGELILYAADGYARILERAFVEAGVTAPEVSLTLETVIAAIKIPVKRLQKRLSNNEDRRIVEAMYDELMATGRVDKSLPDDDRIVRDLYQKEVVAPRKAKRDAKREQRLPATVPAKKTPATAVAPAATASGAQPAPRAASAPRIAPSVEQQTPVDVSPPENRFASALGTVAAAAAQRPTLSSRLENIGIARPPPNKSQNRPEFATAARPSRPMVPGLTTDDDIEAAPSIGPKTAARFYALGIHTVGDFLASDAATAAELIETRHIDVKTIELWQDQARLVMTIPGLRGGHAQLLTGAGYRDLDAIGAADSGELCAAVLRFAATSEGQRILRDGPAPDIERIKQWIEGAATARAA